MNSEVRERMIEGTMLLLARGGPQAASFADVISATGAPRGSLYHHFPNGKRELVEAATERAGTILADLLEPLKGTSPETMVDGFLAIWRTVLIRSKFESGCAVAAFTIAAESGEQSALASRIFQAWILQLTGLLQEGGVSAHEARAFAVMLLASVEGAVILSRAEKSLDPFETVAQQLIAQVRALHTN